MSGPFVCPVGLCAERCETPQELRIHIVDNHPISIKKHGLEELIQESVVQAILYFGNP